MQESLKSLQELTELLKLERLADYELFKQKIQALALEERVEQGYCWHPCRVIKTGYTFGDRAYVLIERIKGVNKAHQLRSGSLVNFFTKRPKIYYPERSGVVHFLQRNRMKIILNTEDLPPWITDGGEHFGVELLFDARTYQEMEQALKTVLEAKDNRLAELRSVLLGHQKPSSHPLSPTQLANLNPSQNRAVQQIVAAKDVAIVHGPPGTGKTTTLVHAIQELCKIEKTVLVTAPSNVAVDLLTERIAALGLRVVRIGNVSRVDESIINHTLDVQLSKHPESKNIKRVKLQAAEARRQAWRFRRKYGRKEREERDQFKTEAKELNAWVRQLEDRLIDQILTGAQVVTATLVGTNNPVLKELNFKTVVIDEAAQALAPANWIPIVRASKVILAGDPFQLPPTVKSREAAKGGLAKTIIEGCIEHMPNVSFLDTQYRMNEAIMAFSNTQFYAGQLQADASVKDQTLPIAMNLPVEFLDTAGCGFEEQLNEEQLSRYNPDEFQILCEHLYQLLDAYDTQQLEYPSIAVISPYREQVRYMKERIEEDPRLQPLELTIKTIDGFQGQEREVVYISLVRCNGKSEIGFLKDYRRMNVAMTRAKHKLVVLGDSATIGNDPFYGQFLEYCERGDFYRTAWEYMAG